MVARMPNRKYAYFRDDQITFLVTHPEAEITSDQLNKLSDSMKPHLEPYIAGPTITWLPSQIFSFPKATGFELEQQAGIISALKEYLSKDNREYNPSDYEPEVFKDEQDQSKLGFSIIVGNINTENQEVLDPSDLIKLIRDLRGRIKDLSDHELTVKSVSPNWIMGNASQGGTTGGPGGLPKPFKGTDQSGGTQHSFNIIGKLADLGLYGTGENVDVAILDTAPCPHDLVIAPKEWPNHPLIERLLGPNGKLRLYPASYDQLLRMGNTSFNSHDYRMSDHGLFAAGIIHSIVPEATIHLIEVLNPFGVGDLLSLVDGFKTVFRDIYKPDEPGRKLVVNCSLMLELPIVEDHCYADEKKDEAIDKEPPDNVDDVEFERDVLQLATEDQQPVLELNELCKKLFCVGRQVVAAAGNDWQNAKARRRRRNPGNNQQRNEPRPDAPAARYPAAFASVVGVGALPRNSRSPQNIHRASTYSNLGDKPTGDGIMTLGGEEGEKKGVLGLYLSEKFPKRSNATNKNEMTLIERRPNQNEDNHWAWWAGTSFATPILTGTIAAVLSTMPTPVNTQEAVRALYNNNVIMQAQTEANEDVMEVTQGQEPS